MLFVRLVSREPFALRVRFSIYYSFEAFGVTYVGVGFNYSSNFVSLPVNIVCTGGSLASYVVVSIERTYRNYAFIQVFFYVWRKNSGVGAKTTQFSGFKRKEVRHTMQFALLSMILLCKISLF